MRIGIALRRSFVALMALATGSRCSAESTVLELGGDESAVKLAVSGETLGVGVAASAEYTPGDGIQERSALVLVRGGTHIRTPLALGFLRDLVAAADGFVMLRVQRPGRPTAVAQVAVVDASGNVTDLPPLSMDPIGLWVDGGGAIHAFSRRSVMRWSAAERAWSTVALAPAYSAGPFVKIIGLAGGQAALITDRAIMSFRRLEEPPLFAKDMGTYPYPLELYGGGDVWWLVSSSEHEQKLLRVARDGAMREVAMLRNERVHDVMSGDGKLVLACAGQGANVHRRTFYVLDPDAGGALGRPRKLPQDTMPTTLWNGAIVSAAPGRPVLRTSNAR